MSAKVQVTNTQDFRQDPVKYTYEVQGPDNTITGVITISKSAVDTSTGLGATIGVAGAGNASPGKMSFVRSITITSTRTVGIRYSVNQNSLNINTGAFSLILFAGKPETIQFNMLLRGSGFANNFGVREWLDTDTTDAKIGFSLDADLMTDDVFVDAKMKMMFVTDSIGNGTGPSTTNNMYFFMMRNYLRHQGVSIRADIRPWSGSQTTGQLPRFIDGTYYQPKVKLYVICLGVNDAGQNIPASTYKANLNGMIDEIFSWENNASVLLVGSSPHANNTNEANAIVQRAKVYEIVNERNSDRIYGFDLGNAFDRTNAGYFASSDPSGSGIHPSDSGHLAIYANKVLPYLQSTVGISLIGKLKSY